MEYAFGKSDKLLDTDLDPKLRKSQREGAEVGQMLKHFPWFFTLLDALPESLLERNPDFKGLISRRKASTPGQPNPIPLPFNFGNPDVRSTGLGHSEVSKEF